MDSGDLRYFAAVARLGGMSRAAEALHTVQSNVTARILRLEADLGTPLFRRHSRGAALTPAGERLLPHARRVERLLAEAREAAVGDGRPRGPLVVGSLETTAAVRLPPVLLAYAAAHPEVDLTLRTGTTAELVEAVLARDLEGAFVCGPVDHPDLHAELVLREELALVAAPAIASPDDLAARGDVRIVVLRAGCSYRQRLEAILARRGIVDLRRLEFGTIDGILGCVRAGLGVTLLPRSVVARAAPAAAVRVHDLPAGEAVVETLFVRRRDDAPSPALAAFLDAARPAGGAAGIAA